MCIAAGVPSVSSPRPWCAPFVTYVRAVRYVVWLRGVPPFVPPSLPPNPPSPPLLQCDVDGDFGIIELAHDGSNDTMTVVFGYMALYPNDALSIFAEAVKFTRYQVALYGQLLYCPPSCSSLSVLLPGGDCN